MQPEIAFSAADTAEDVQRCIAVLLSTRAGSVAMDREFGLSWDFVDLPVEHLAVVQIVRGRDRRQGR